MIDKVPPSFSKSGSADAFDDDDLEPGIDKSASGIDQEEELTDRDGDENLDAAAILAAQKRRGNNVLIFGGAICALVLVGFGYPRFKHYFVSDQPAVQTDISTPVPVNARKNYFAGSDKAAPSGTDGAQDPAMVSPSNNVDITSSQGALPTPPVEPKPAPTENTLPGTTPAPAVISPTISSSAAISTTPSTTGTATANSVSDATATTVPLSQPMAGGPTQSGAAPDEQLKSLKDSVDKLTDAQNADGKRMQALEADMAALQQQISQLKPAGTEVQSGALKTGHVVARHRTARSDAWVLRSATNDMALIGHAGTNDLKKVTPGDVVSGLGKITSIEEQNGVWVVHGTGGSLEQ